MGIIIVTVRDSTNVGCKRWTRTVQRDKLGVIQQLLACMKGESVSRSVPGRREADARVVVTRESSVLFGGGNLNIGPLLLFLPSGTPN